MHAAHEAGARFGAPAGCFLIATVTPDAPSLLALHEHLLANSVRSLVFTEPDLGGRPTALAALVDHVDRSLFRHLPLWRLP